MLAGWPVRRALHCWCRAAGGRCRAWRGAASAAAQVIEGKFSLRASVTGQIVMEDVRVPVENILPKVKGLKGPFSCLNNARCGWLTCPRRTSDLRLGTLGTLGTLRL